MRGEVRVGWTLLFALTVVVRVANAEVATAEAEEATTEAEDANAETEDEGDAEADETDAETEDETIPAAQPVGPATAQTPMSPAVISPPATPAAIAATAEDAEGSEGPVTLDEVNRARLREQVREQLERDERPLPSGMGAIFVGALTDPTLEPAADVFRDGELVETSPTARKIFLRPGSYLVRVGRGNDRVRPSFEVEVTEGEVSMIVPTWGALVIDVVDDHNIPHRGAYDLIRLDTRETVGQGRGADRRTGEGLRTWLLIPGVYKIVQPGGTYRERVDFVTVRVLPGEAIAFTLVIAPETGEFRGGGIAPEREPTTVGGLRLRGALGGSLELTHRHQVAGATDGLTFGGDLFFDFDLLFDRELHYLSAQLQIEAGMILLPDLEDWRKTLDYADLAAIYVLQLHPRVGPYINFEYDTHMLPGHDYLAEPREVVLLDENGDELERIPDVERVSLGRSFSRNDLREGIGANWRALRSRYLDLDLRLGVGFQQLITNDLYRRSDDEDTAALEYRRAQPFTHREGIDLGIVAAGSLTGWLSYDVEFALLEPFNDFANPVINLDLTLTIRLFSYASLNYLLRVRRDIVIVEDGAQVDQALLLRFAFNLF